MFSWQNIFFSASSAAKAAEVWGRKASRWLLVYLMESSLDGGFRGEEGVGGESVRNDKFIKAWCRSFVGFRAASRVRWVDLPCQLQCSRKLCNCWLANQLKDVVCGQSSESLEREWIQSDSLKLTSTESCQRNEKSSKGKLPFASTKTQKKQKINLNFLIAPSTRVSQSTQVTQNLPCNRSQLSQPQPQRETFPPSSISELINLNPFRILSCSNNREKPSESKPLNSASNWNSKLEFLIKNSRKRCNKNFAASARKSQVSPSNCTTGSIQMGHLHDTNGFFFHHHHQQESPRALKSC